MGKMLLITCLLLMTATCLHAKTERTLFDEDAVARIKYKAENYDWGGDSADATIRSAQWLAEKSDEELWDFVPPPGQWRAINVCFARGCPEHGKEIFRKGGHYPWVIRRDRPFKVECPVGGEVYPSNEVTSWNPNSIHEEPATGLPVTDNGAGWMDADGNRYFFVAYWNFWQRWKRDILGGVTDLYRAYLLTDDPIYARKCAILLARIAEYYPDYDYPTQAYHSISGFGVAGRVQDRIWENGTITVLTSAYDAIFPVFAEDAELGTFLRSQGVDDGPRLIEQNLLKTMADDLMSGYIRGNVGMYQRSLSHVAIVLDNDDPDYAPTTEQMREWIMTGSGDTEYLLWNSFFRDGHGGESSPGYSAGWTSSFYLIAELLPKLGVDIWSNPKMLKMADTGLELAVTGRFTPSIGDAGSIFGARRTNWSPAVQGRAFTQYRQPQHAASLQMMNARSESLWTDYFDDEELARYLEEKEPQLEFETRNLGGYGLAILETGEEPHKRGMSMYYGYAGGGHGHRDRLTMEMFAYDRPMLTEMGYPAHWGDKARHWTNNTISHYCVVVNQQWQQTMNRGYLNTLASAPGIQLMDADAADGAYPGITSMYRRTAALIDIAPDRSYVLDLFRVRGGYQHDYSFHGPPFPEFSTSGTETVSVQQRGTLAGEGVQFGQAPTAQTQLRHGGVQLRLHTAEPLVGDSDTYRTEADNGWCSYLSNAILTRKQDAQVRLAIPEVGPGEVKLLVQVHNYQRGQRTATFTLGDASADFTWEEDGGTAGRQWLSQTLELDRAVSELTITATETQGSTALIMDAYISLDTEAEPHQFGDLRTSGFQYLFDVRRKQASGTWSATWFKLDEDLALTMTVPAGSMDEIIACRAEAELKPHHPETLDYVLGRNVVPDGAAALDSDFIVVAEPHMGPARVQDVRRLQSADPAPDAIGLLVQRDDQADLVHSSLDPQQPCTWEGAGRPFSATAEFALATADADGVTRAVVVNGTRLTCGDLEIELQPSPAGLVEAVDFDANSITIDVELDNPEAFIGQVIILGSDQNQTSYTIEGITVEEGKTTLEFGNTLFLIQMGYVTEADTAASTVTLAKLGRVDGGRHQGRWLYNEDRSVGLQITECNGSKFTVNYDGDDLDAVFADISADGRRQYWISDIGPGDWFRIPAVTYVERRGGHAYRVRTMTNAVLKVPHPDVAVAPWNQDD